MRKLHHIGIRIFNFEAAKNNKTKRKIKQIFRKSNVPVFLKKKRKKVFPPFPLQGLWQSRDCVFGFLERH